VWLWLTVGGAIVAAGAVAAVLGITNLTVAVILSEQTSIIEQDR
jgi:hypothetical protein